MPTLPKRVSNTGYSWPGRDAHLDFAARQRHLAILADQLAVGPDQHGDVVNQVRVALDQSGHDVQIVLLGQRAEVLGRRAGHRLGHVGVGLAQARLGERLAAARPDRPFARRPFRRAARTAGSCRRGRLAALGHDSAPWPAAPCGRPAAGMGSSDTSLHSTWPRGAHCRCSSTTARVALLGA